MAKVIIIGKKKKKSRKLTDLIIDDYKSLTLDDPSDVTANKINNNNNNNAGLGLIGNRIECDSTSFHGGFEIMQCIKQILELDKINKNINASKLRRGDLILIMG